MAFACDKISISTGIRGLQISLKPKNPQKTTQANIVILSHKKRGQNDLFHQLIKS